MTRSATISDLHLTRVSLVARHPDPMIEFYTRQMGMTLVSRSTDASLLGYENGHALLELVHNADARQRPGQAPGLFHVAYLFPARAHLATALKRLVRLEWPLQGAADHGVSEAIYLADPEGNGIEIYADRPKDTWPIKNGQLRMVTEALDVRGLLAEPETDATQPQARIGHVHLQVSSLTAADAFWCGTIGLNATQRDFPGALFVSAGGYHHHIGLNTWRSEGQTLPTGDWTGLRSVSMGIADGRELLSLGRRLRLDQDGPAEGFSATFETTEIHIHPISTTYIVKESQ